ncbi:MAG: spermidine synthase, partial [Candidatus Gottesmanbacteria bacterium]|nr:spermidine synthase [Candidatus Gottesmanbacteria bacterium]
TNVRLESFVYTKESFEQAKKHLTDRGVFILYNYYRKTWLVDKLAGMLQDVFQQNPISYSVGEAAKLAVLMVGPRINDLSPSATLIPYTIQHTETPATDNWPFLYLRGPNIPALYTHFLLVILAIIFIVTTGTLLYKRSRFDLRFFLFGAAFLLLETKNLVTFGLLFGSTWQVNAVVFAVILLSVLSANLLSMHFTIRPTWILYLALGTSIGVAALLPKSFLLSLPELTRYTVASVIYFAPVVFANLIFSQLFGKSHDPTVSLGSNILGAVIGGLLEYSSLTFGYNTLYIIIALCYMLAFFLPSNTFFYATSQRH